MKMNFVFRLLIVCFSVGAGAGAAATQPAIESERGRIAAARSSAQAGFAVEESACYERFWVNDCLADIKARRLDVLSDLRRQEVALNDQQRKAQGADQLQKIEEKLSLTQQQVEADVRAVAANKAQAKTDRDAQKKQGLISPEAQQVANAQLNVADAAQRLIANQAKLASRTQKQQLAAQEFQKFEAKQRKAKERQDKNKTTQSSKTKSPALPPQPNL